MDDLLQKTKDKLVDLVRNGSFEFGKELATQGLKVFDDLILKQYLGICCLGMQQYEEAKTIFENNVASDGLAEDYNNLSICLRFLKQYDLAHENGLKSIELQKNNPSFFANLATTLAIQKDYHGALDYITKALTLSPSTSSFWYDKANLHLAIRDLSNAEECYRASLRLKPINEKYCVDLFYCMAFQYKFPEAWKFYEFRYNTMPHVANIINRSRLPVLLEKKDFYEEKIVISFEQGYGDNMMFLRFLKYFQKIAPNSYLLIQDSNLGSYVEKLGICYKKNIEKNTDKIVCLMSLPYHLNVAEIPPPEYLFEHRPQISDKIKIGICWAGSALHPMDYQRSTYLKWYWQFFDNENCEIYGLVKDRRPRMHKENQNIVDFFEDCVDLPIIDLSTKMDTVLDTINALQSIDILVTVDTFLAHIAGTIKVPTYLILSNLPDWRWGLYGDSTPWYPSFKIIRQQDEAFDQTVQNAYEKIRSDYSLLISKDKKIN